MNPGSVTKERTTSPGPSRQDGVKLIVYQYYTWTVSRTFDEHRGSLTSVLLKSPKLAHGKKSI